MSETGEAPKEVQTKTRRQFLKELAALTAVLAACGKVDPEEEPDQAETQSSEPKPDQPIEESTEKAGEQEQAPQKQLPA